MAGKVADLSGKVEPIAAATKQKLLSLLSNLPFPSEYRPTRPPISMKIPNTKLARGLEKLDPFHSMHYEHPRFTAQHVFDDEERQARVPTKWTDILEGRVEATPCYETLIAEFTGEVEEERAEDSQNGGFCMM